MQKGAKAADQQAVHMMHEDVQMAAMSHPSLLVLYIVLPQLCQNSGRSLAGCLIMPCALVARTQ
jgi:hypothetical protein